MAAETASRSRLASETLEEDPAWNPEDAIDDAERRRRELDALVFPACRTDGSTLGLDG